MQCRAYVGQMRLIVCATYTTDINQMARRIRAERFD